MPHANVPLYVTPLPGMGAVNVLTEWIERNEYLLASYLLAHDDGDANGNTLCAAFLSRNDDGEYLLRLCEGFSDAMMVWREQRRARPMFGQGYAEAIISQWLTQRERMGYRIDWRARRAEQVASMSRAA